MSSIERRSFPQMEIIQAPETLPSQDALTALLDALPVAVIHSSADGALYMNKAAKTLWGTDEESSFEPPFDPEDERLTAVIDVLAADKPTQTAQTTHEVRSIHPDGTKIETNVIITKTHTGEITMVIEDATAKKFAGSVRQAFHELNNIATQACGGQALGIDTAAGREFVEAGIGRLYELTQQIHPLHDQARHIQGETTNPLHILRPLSSPAS